MTGEEDMALPLYENLRKNYGIVVKTSREMVYARSANAELAEKLDINEGGADPRPQTLRARRKRHPGGI